MPPSDPPAHNRKRRDSKPAKWGKRALAEAVQRAAQLTNWMRKKGLPHLLKLMKWVARMTVSLARRFASCLGQKALPRARQIVASLVTALAKLGDQKAKRKRGKSSIRPAERLETAESAPGGAPATPRETEAAPPLVVQNVCEGPDEELLARESPAENHAPEVPVPTRDVPSEEPPRIIEAAPIPQEVPPSVGAVAKRPRKGGSLPLRQFFNTIRSGGLMGLKRWIIPVALLAMAGLIGISLLGKMRRDLWAYYTDGQDLRAEVEEDKTRFVLWQDPEAHHFDKTPPQKDASEEQPQPASKHLPGRLEAAFSPDGTQMILVRWEEHETNADLFVSHWDGRLWSPPEAIKSINTSSDERSPAFSRDGQFLYFSSNREGGKGGLDLYLARRNGSQWEGVVSLGDKINTADDESGPALSSDDKQLFFSSNREGAKGEDIFVADSVAGTRKAEDKLAPVPRFLEAEAVSHLNSRAHDVQAALTARGNHVFLASDRDSSGRKGYAVYFSRVVAGVSLKPEKVDLYIKQGNVTDPAVRMDGFDLLFSANHETDSSEDDPNYRLYRSTTREVIGYTDLSRWEQFKELLGNVAWWLILAVAALIALIYLLESWQDISSLFHKCLAGSAIVHLLMLVGMAALVIAQELEKQAELPPSEIQISLDALTEQELALESVPEETEVTQPDLSLPTEKAAANFEVPELQPQEEAQAMNIDAQFQQEAMQVEVKTANANPIEEHNTQPVEPSALLSELSETVLPEPNQPVLDEREFADAPEAANPEDSEFKPNETLPAPERSESGAVADTAMETPPEVAEVEPSETIADDPAQSALIEVTPTQSNQAEGDQSDAPQALESELLAELPDSSPLESEQVELDEGEPNAAAEPANESFTPDNSVAGASSAQAESEAVSDAAAQSQAQTSEVANGGVAAAPVAEGPASPVGEATNQSELPEATITPGQMQDLPAAALLDTGTPRLDEGDPNPNQAPANPANEQFTPNGAVAENSTTPLEGSPTSDAAVPSQADAAEVASGEVSNTPLPASPTSAVGEAQAEESVPATEIATGLSNNLPETALLDPGAPQLEEGDGQPAAPANPGEETFKPGAASSQPVASQKAGGAPSDSALNEPTEATEVGKGELAATPAQQGSASAVGEAQSEEGLPGPSALANNLPEASLLDPGTPTLEEGAHQGAPADSSKDQFKPGAAQLATAQASGGPASDQASSSAVDAGTVSGAGLVAENPQLTGPQSGLEAGVSETPTTAGTLGAASLEPTLTSSLLPGKLEAPEGDTGAMTDFLKKQRGRPSLNVIKGLGGSDGTEKAIEASIRWLAENQEKSGRWNSREHGAKGNFDTGVTGLALLCFYGWGARHDEEGEYRQHVGRALDWLLSQQEQNGNLRAKGMMYCHSIASIALCEAYGVTKDPKLREPAERAIAYTLAAQSKTKGGWRYRPGNDSDTSITGWQFMALHSARLAGLKVPEKHFELARKWFDTAGGGKHGGLYGYQGPGKKSPAMVATGMFCRQLDLAPPTSPKQIESAKLIGINPMRSRTLDFYYIYYATLALYQHQGPIWDKWNEALKDSLPRLQRKTGSRTGSWDTSRGLAGNGGRVASTALATLSLEVYYRILPIYGFRGEEEQAPELKEKENKE